MAYESISYDELNAEHAALMDAASEKYGEQRGERRDDVADLSADEQERDAAQWSEGAPACLAAVVFAQRMRQRLAERGQDGHSEHANSRAAVARGHAVEDA